MIKNFANKVNKNWETFWKPLEPVYYEIERVSDSSEGYYKCHVETSRGSDEGITFLDVEEQPPIVTAMVKTIENFNL